MVSTEEVEIEKGNNIKNKGSVGQIIERGYFGLENNSDSEPDFKKLKVELKVTPIKQNKNKSISAKERLVMNIINYEEEYKKDFYTSSFWLKNQKLLLVFYLWEKEKDKLEYKVLKAYYHELSGEDLEIIKSDWKKIMSKIISGKAHELSEGDTNYLGACTKGANRNSLRKQPFSDVRAMQRAFSLKGSYITALAREKITEQELLRVTDNRVNKKKFKKNTIIKDTKILEKESFDNYVLNLFSKYIGWTLEELKIYFNLDSENQPKHLNYIIAQNILGVGGTTKEIHAEEFEKANIIVKTIELNKGGKPIESLKILEVTDFKDISNVDWEDSRLYDKLESAKYLFIVFDKLTNGSIVLKDVRFWTMPRMDLDDMVRKTWEEEKVKLNTGVKLTYQPTNSVKGYEVLNNLVKLTNQKIIHLRPSATKSQYSAKYRDESGKLINNAKRLPRRANWVNRPADLKKELTDDWMTKQAFWLNNNYIYNQITHE